MTLPSIAETLATARREVLWPVRSQSKPKARPATEGPRRALNVVVALVGLAATSPLMLIIAVLIKVTSRGPVLFTQQRVGLDRRAPLPNAGNGRRATDCGGRPFTMYKFRTMRPENGDSQRQVWATPNDPRVTSVGAFLRRYRLDELPQLYNVLLGDMNVVGPRPEQPAIARELRGVVDWYHLRQRVRPGITGWAQINQHYDASVDDVRRKVAFDLQYISRQSLLEDLRIMALTVPVMVFRRGAW